MGQVQSDYILSTP